MFDSLPEMTTAVKALIFVLFLIVAVFGVFWALRRYAGAGGNAGARGRQPRLGQVDYIDLPDGRRKLIIVRRDNVEHLVMIGGPNDVVVEQNIVRGGAPRNDKVEASLGRVLAVAETLPRPVPLGEPTAFPLQPQTEANGRAAPRPADDQAQWQWPAQSEPAQRAEPNLDMRLAPRTNAVSKPASEVSARAASPREPAATRPVTPPPVSRPAPVATPAAAAPTPVIPPSATPPSAPIVKVGIDEKIMANAGSDKNLTDMAHMLEASLRRQGEPRFTEGPMAVKPAPMVLTPAPNPQPKVDAKPAAPKSYDSLEEEMASLLGRPPGKP